MSSEKKSQTEASFEAASESTLDTAAEEGGTAPVLPAPHVAERLELSAEQENALRERLEHDGLLQSEGIDNSTPSQGEGAEYRVVLDAYAGPLDLLLYLVKRHEIDLANIPMTLLIDQYMRHLQVIQEADIDRAGEFLVMAATLLEIKSKLIMANDPTKGFEEEVGSDEETSVVEDPRLLLVQQLLAYKKFKDAAWTLEERQAEWENRFQVRARAGKRVIDATVAPQLELDLGDLSVFDLHGAFQRMIETIGYRGDHQVQYDDTPVALHAEDIASLLQFEMKNRPEIAKKGMSLREICQGRRHRSEMIGLFLATLELIRDHRVRLQLRDGGQAGVPEDLFYIPCSAEEQAADKANMDEHTSWKNSETGDIDYDWPDEESRIRALRREKLRETLAAKADAEARGEDFDLAAYKKQRALNEADEIDELDEGALLEEDDFAQGVIEDNIADQMPDVEID